MAGEIARILTEGITIASQVDPVLSSTLATATILSSGKKLITYLVGKRKSAVETVHAASPVETPAEIEPRDDVAIVVEVTRPIATDVARFLDAQEIDANLVLIKPATVENGRYPFLDPTDHETWSEIVRDFARACTDIQAQVGTANYHLFVSTPLPLAFGVGAVWGTVRNATIYHYDGGNYVPSMRVDRTLRY